MLDISLNDAADKGAAALARMLRANTSLRNLDLDRNRVGDAGAAALAGGLEQNAALQVLGLARNQVGDAGMRTLEQCFLHGNRTVVELRLVSNPAHGALLNRVLTAVADNVAPPSALAFTHTPARYGFRNRVRPNKAAVAGTPPFKFSVMPPLPKGLLLDADEGTIYGVPLECAPMLTYTVTARNASGETQGRLHLSVQALVGQSRRASIAGDAASASFVTAFSFADPKKGRGMLDRAQVLEALRGLQANATHLDGVLEMLEIPVGVDGAFRVDLSDFCFVAAALLSASPELLPQPLRRPMRK